jgi:Domain of unknown function (DUF4349)
MRRTDEPLDPEILAQLDAIDATVAGEPVDPEYAELAELALLLSAERQAPEPEFAGRLDERVSNRFRAPLAAKRPRRWVGPFAGLSAAAVAAVVAVVVVSSGGGVPSTSVESTTAAPQAAQSSGSTASGGSADVQSGPAKASSSARSAAASATAPTFAQPSTAAPQPPANGRKIVQSAQLQLNAPPSRIEDVAQQVFDVVGREKGVVNNSNVTAGSGGYAQFQLSIPSGNLGATMTALSNLRYANVASRTDTTQDVNKAYVSANRQLADDRALRTSLLRQLGKAVTQAQIDSINGRIHDAEHAIARDEAAIRSLNNKINYSQVSVDVNGHVGPVAHSSSKGFTIGKAAHDAGRVLTVVAGVALIALAVLVPLALVGGLAAWIAVTVRRRRREQALDVA